MNRWSDPDIRPRTTNLRKSAPAVRSAKLIMPKKSTGWIPRSLRTSTTRHGTNTTSQNQSANPTVFRPRISRWPCKWDRWEATWLVPLDLEEWVRFINPHTRIMVPLLAWEVPQAWAACDLPMNSSANPKASAMMPCQPGAPIFLRRLPAPFTIRM